MEFNGGASTEVEKLQHRCHVFKIIQILLTVVVTLQGIGMHMMWNCITGLAGNVSGIVENVGIISDILEMLCSVG